MHVVDTHACRQIKICLKEKVLLKQLNTALHQRAGLQGVVTHLLLETGMLGNKDKLGLVVLGRALIFLPFNNVKSIKPYISGWVVVAHIFNPSPQEAEAGRPL